MSIPVALASGLDRSLGREIRMPRRGHLMTFFTSAVLFVLHPVRDNRLELCAEIRAVKRFFLDDDQILVLWIRAVPLQRI